MRPSSRKRYGATCAGCLAISTTPPIHSPAWWRRSLARFPQHAGRCGVCFRQLDIARGPTVSSPTKRTGAARTASFTALQGQYLAFIHTYEGIHGCAPAEADLQRHFGVTPPSVHQMVVTLERKGLITRVAGAARSIKLQIASATLPSLEHRE